MKKKLLVIFIAFVLIATLVFQVVSVSAQSSEQLDHLLITPSTATVVPGGTLQFSAKGYTSGNVEISGLNLSWIVIAGGGAINNGLFTAGTVTGTFTNTVEVYTSLNGISRAAFATVVVGTGPGALDHVVITPSSTTLIPGGTQQFTAQAYDINNVAISGLTYTWAAANGGGTISSTGLFTAGAAAGTFANTVQVTTTQGTITKMAFGTVIVSTSAGALDHIVISPPSATLAAGGTQQFSAQAYDINNIAINGLTYTWTATSGGTINGTGLFTAGGVVGTYTNNIQAAATQGIITKTAFATVIINTSGQLDHIVINPSATTLTLGGAQQFTAQGYDVNNIAIASLGYTWNVVAGGGTIGSTGLFVAGNTAGNYLNTIQVLAVQGSIVKVASASVTVTTGYTPVTPTTLNMNTRELLSLANTLLRDVRFENLLGGLWTVKEGNTIYNIEAIPGILSAAPGTSITITPNDGTGPITLAINSNTLLLPDKTKLNINDKVVAITINDQLYLVLKVTDTSSSARLPPGLAKKDNDKFFDRWAPIGWSKGKKIGWSKDHCGD